MQDLEAAWVYHELGRCYLETGKTEKAKEYGDKSYEYAQSADDEVWQLHSSVLIAQSQGVFAHLLSTCSTPPLPSYHWLYLGFFHLHVWVTNVECS